MGKSTYYVAALLILIPLVLFLGVCPAFPDEVDLAQVQKGLDLLNGQNPEEAVTIFSGMMSDGTMLSDFLLLWRARAYYQTSKYEKALEDIGRVEKEFPESPVLQDALRLRISISLAKDGEDESVLNQYESYISRYPGDRGARYDYAKLLKGRGLEEKAEDLFKQLFIDSADFSNEAAAEFNIAELDNGEMLQRGENLLKQWKFADAENVFNAVLSKIPEDRREEIEEKIALCEFRQKRYAASAQLYSRLNDKYMEAVSYLRIDDMNAFRSALESLKSMKDPRAGQLLIALASEKRRSGLSTEALDLLRETRAEFPFREDAAWDIGWTQYMAGDYASSVETFRVLYDTYGSNKYLYWMLRSTERMSSAPVDGYRKLCSEKDYYGFLGCLRAGEKVSKVTIPDREADIDSPLLKRYRMLKSLGLRKEALFELKKLVKNLKGTEEIMLYSKKLRDIGEYKNAIAVATKLPYKEEIHGLLYPFAYWDVVQDAAGRFEVNPLYILSIAREESRLDPEAKSVAGAVGLMQLMPQTAHTISNIINYDLSNKGEFFDVQTNIVLGTYYLKTLLDRYKSIALATAAYNAGENAVDKWLGRYQYSDSDEFIEDIPYQETRNYVKKVLSTFYQYIRVSSESDFEQYLLRGLDLSSEGISQN